MCNLSSYRSGDNSGNDIEYSVGMDALHTALKEKPHQKIRKIVVFTLVFTRLHLDHATRSKQFLGKANR